MTTWRGLRRTGGPDVEPVTLEEAKLHLRVDVDDDDDYITSIVVVARELVEQITRRSLISQEWQLTLDTWPPQPFEIPLPPLQSATVDYTDLDGVSHAVAATVFGVDTEAEPGRLYVESGQSWPGGTLAGYGGVQITFVAGYGDAGTDVPQAIRQAILLLVGHLYENREAVAERGQAAVLPMGVEYLLMPWRVFTAW